MKSSELIQLFASSLAGVIIYQLLVYISAPYNPDWLNLSLETIFISLIVTTTVSLVRWWRAGRSEQTG